MHVKNRCVQILSDEQFDKIFGNTIRESESADAEDPVLDWYRRIGKPLFSGSFCWDEYMSRLLDQDPSPLLCPGEEEYDKLMSVIADFEDPTWQAAAKTLIRSTLDTDLLEFAGMGSAKVTLVSKTGKAVKFGRWRGDGSDEIRTAAQYSKDYYCLPRLYDYAEDYTSYVCECARESTPADFERLLGYDSAWSLVRAINRKDPVLMKKAESPEPKWKSIRSLIDFQHNVQMLIDIDENNWGLTVRDGQPVLIVIDYEL